MTARIIPIRVRRMKKWLLVRAKPPRQIRGHKIPFPKMHIRFKRTTPNMNSIPDETTTICQNSTKPLLYMGSTSVARRRFASLKIAAAAKPLHETPITIARLEMVLNMVLSCSFLVEPLPDGVLARFGPGCGFWPCSGSHDVTGAAAVVMVVVGERMDVIVNRVSKMSQKRRAKSAGVKMLEKNRSTVGVLVRRDKYAHEGAKWRTD